MQKYFLGLFLLLLTPAVRAQQTMNLSGQWQVRLDDGESIDNFVNNRRLAQVFETKVGKGCLVFSSIDLLTDTHLPELRQFQYSLVCYMLSSDFHPTTSLSEADLRSLLLQEATEQRTDANSIYN